jgi:hypothetical protein
MVDNQSSTVEVRVTVVNMGEESVVSFRVLVAGGFEGNDMNEKPSQFKEWN